jgi:hypothetical protein
MADKLTLTLETKLIRGTASVADTLPSTVTDTGIVNKDTGEFTIAANATDQLVDLAACGSADYLHVEVDAACTIKLNGSGNTGIVFAPITGQVGVLALAGAAITALYVTNPAATAFKLRLLAAANS